MKKTWCLLVLFALSFFACQSDSTTENTNQQIETTQPTQNIKNSIVSPKETSSTKNQINTTAPAKEKVKSTFNAGKANKLGTQFGKRYCKCMKDGGKTAKCEETILKSMNNMENAIDPRIFKALKRAYDSGKSNCS